MERDKKIAVENLGEGESRKSACVVLAREAVRIKGLREISLCSNILRKKPLRLSMFDFFGVNQEGWLLYTLRWILYESSHMRKGANCLHNTRGIH